MLSSFSSNFKFLIKVVLGYTLSEFSQLIITEYAHFLVYGQLIVAVLE